MIGFDSKKIGAFVLSIFFFNLLHAQTTIVLQPDGALGKDAYIDSRLSTNNYGSHIDFPAIAWTNGQTPVNVRGLISFDFSGIPNGATINTASLSLYSYNSPANGSHSNQSGSNQSILSRVTSSWDENSVNWNNQPSITSQNQVILPASTSAIQDYLNMDVTNMVQDMINDPANSYGFLLKLATEQYYRRMVFASSDNSNALLHPKLEITYTEAIQADSCITIRPSANQGKDAYIDSRMNTNNYGSHIDFPSIAWTNGQIPVNARGLIDFDFSSIPNGAIINSANLSLYSYNSPANGSHSTQNGSNESVLSRITSLWDENTVTWNNQPSITTQNQVYLPASTNSIQDYLNIDVTNMVQDMINDPSNSYGFLLKLVTEEFYQRMVFASSDNSNPNLHPKLEVCYSLTNSLTESTSNTFEWSLYPNPAKNTITIDLNNFNQDKVSIEISNSQGQIIRHIEDNHSSRSLDISNCSKGLFFVKIAFNNTVSIKKLVIE
jgi:hypothetical protein